MQQNNDGELQRHLHPGRTLSTVPVRQKRNKFNLKVSGETIRERGHDENCNATAAASRVAEAYFKVMYVKHCIFNRGREIEVLKIFYFSGICC
jgi:hypothetical protein